MLTTQEIERLKDLISGRRQPTDGMEKHFLRVIKGDAPPCSTKEQEWYQYWKQEPINKKNSDDCRLDYNKVIDEHPQQDEIIVSLKKQIREQDASIAALKKKVAMLEEFLKKTHEALEKYEPTSSPLVTNVEAENERKMRDAEQKATHHFTKGIYSSTDGQD